MNWRMVVSSALAAVVLNGCATRDPFVHTRPLVSQSELLGDIDRCQALARTGGAGANGMPYNPALPSQAGAALGAGIGQGIAQAQAQQTGYERCMADRGYLQTTLTADELTAYRALKTEDERKAWLAAFAARDHGERSVRRTEPECRPNLLVACN
ncbi:MAG: hypothetical protein PSV23_16655 [Brevundimonas sp.]|uniref:hypothetical protein n=1 Tax=Brevundimonas sp. TaxID=1871086 RepID=UPI002488CECE|nr:hypothetical protein [Brevundimonas sp.]MDI1328422.1 hypothetical protein [Brevundimonas sp.]